MSLTRISIFELVCHEIRVSFREKIRRGVDEDKLRSRILSRKLGISKSLAKYCGLFLLAVLISYTTSEGEFVSIRTSIANIDIPEVYVHFISVGFFLSAFIRLVQLVVFMEVDADLEYGAKRVHRFPSASRVFDDEDGEDYDVISAVRSSHFILPNRYVSASLNALFCLAILAALLPLAGAWWFILVESHKSTFGNSTAFLQFPFAILSVFLLLLPLPFSVLFFARTKFRKNFHYLRWQFLSPIWTRQKRTPHPQAPKWVKERKR